MRSVSYGFLLQEMHKKLFSWCFLNCAFRVFSLSYPLMSAIYSTLELACGEFCGSLALRNRHNVCVTTEVSTLVTHQASFILCSLHLSTLNSEALSLAQV